jgi:hypothetical protein
MSRQQETKPKIGAEHASAMWRQGLRELRAAVYPESNVSQPPEYGVYGTKTPGEVAQDRRADGPDLEDEKSKGRGSVLESRSRQAEARSDRGDKGKGMERG